MYTVQTVCFAFLAEGCRQFIRISEKSQLSSLLHGSKMQPIHGKKCAVKLRIITEYLRYFTFPQGGYLVILMEL
jgi:hypothetical protein